METLKIVIAGAHGCGKTAFATVSAGRGYDQCHIRTLGVEVTPAVINLGDHNNNYPHLVNIWDRAGHPDSLGLGNGYNIGANGVFICINLNAPVVNVPDVYIPEGSRVIYLGLKADVANADTVTLLAANNIRYIPVSAKLGTGIREAWRRMLE